MANKWRSSITEANAIFAGYKVNPSDLSTETLIRKWTGIDRSVLQARIATLRAITTVTNPKADGQTYSGTWTVDSVEPSTDEGGNTAGSAAIIQVLKKDVYSSATPDNMIIIRSRAYPLEQNENSWMYYERYKSEITRRWHNILAANIEAEYDKINRIYNSFIDDIAPWPGLYVIVYADARNPIVFGVARTAGTYWQGVLSQEQDGSWYASNVSEISNPILRDVWYEQNPDGTYNLFREMETVSSVSVMRVRVLQYAGMTLVKGAPILDDTKITISGFNNLTEVVYANSRFRVGSDTYRVMKDTVAVAGVAADIPINPPVTQETEDACDANTNNVQVFWDAL